MPSRRTDYPIFDADNHMYETPDGHAPPAGELRGVQRAGEGAHEIAVKGQISDYIEPDLRWWPRP